MKKIYHLKILQTTMMIFCLNKINRIKNRKIARKQIRGNEAIDTSHIKSNLDIYNNPEELIDIDNPKLPVSKLKLIMEKLKKKLDLGYNYLYKDRLRYKRSLCTRGYQILLELIKYVNQNEKLFWKNSGFSELSDIKNLKDKLLDRIGKFNFCKHSSLFLTYFPGLIHMNFFVENLIKEDINLVKNACLWILLLKYVESLTFISIKDLNTSGICHETYDDIEYEGFEIYTGNKIILCKMKELYETFEAIACQWRLQEINILLAAINNKK
ncbi:hypothetical protein CWI38_0017p0030 [Hamiltosporidium tvaerminnensis]|uniref:Uncharacterized protein n=1 Tax=Hamiltosporidium tvaerminnensis TaxID=1176355 RepID=A0A4Q9M506_9MICR|nr:hypothetical protein CWI38_0017p0030 [Hamiltosporidium tvaerminnensis]